MRNRRPILLTTGDPEGIGPDLVGHVVSEQFHHPFVIIGSQNELPLDLPLVDEQTLSLKKRLFPFSLLQPQYRPDHPASFSSLEQALTLLDKGFAQALVTGPIDKKSWLDRGIRFKGHTELLQSRYNRQAIMFFWSQTLKVALYTVHCPLSSMHSALSIDGIGTFLDTLIPSLTPLMGKGFRIVIAGLNPHAGEHGIMGDEEEHIIKPAMEMARTRHKVDISGPYPADTLFYTVREDQNTVIIAWYHDQGLIPFKLMHFNDGVNVTLGLPFLRTSPDHGTAVNLKGTQRINPGSMLAAAHLADNYA